MQQRVLKTISAHPKTNKYQTLDPLVTSIEKTTINWSGKPVLYEYIVFPYINYF